MFNVSKIPAKGTDGKPIDTSRYPGSFVWLNVYDLGENRAMQRTNNLGKMFGGGIYHAALEVYGNEWSYGYTDEPGTGVHKCQPRAAYGHTYRSTTKMGVTKLTQVQVSKLIQKLSDEWVGLDYNLIEHNCLHFANAFADHLGVGRLPSWVDRVGRTAAKITSLAPGSHWKKHSAEEPGPAGNNPNLAGPRTGLSTGFGMGAIHDKNPSARAWDQGPGYGYGYGEEQRSHSHGAGVGRFPGQEEEEDLLLGHTGKHFPHGARLGRPDSADSLKVSLGRSAPPGPRARGSPSKESTGVRSRSLRDFFDDDFADYPDAKAGARSSSRRRTLGPPDDEELAERSKPSTEDSSPKPTGERKKLKKSRSASQQPGDGDKRPESKEKAALTDIAEVKKSHRRSTSTGASNVNANNINANANATNNEEERAAGERGHSRSPRARSKQADKKEEQEKEKQQDKEKQKEQEKEKDKENRPSDENAKSSKKSDAVLKDAPVKSADGERGRRNSGGKKPEDRAPQGRSASAEPGRKPSLKRSNTGETALRASKSKTRDLDEVLATAGRSNSNSRPRLSKAGSSSSLGRGAKAKVETGEGERARSKERRKEKHMEKEKENEKEKEAEKEKDKGKKGKEKEKEKEREKDKEKEGSGQKPEAAQKTSPAAPVPVPVPVPVPAPAPSKGTSKASPRKGQDVEEEVAVAGAPEKKRSASRSPRSKSEQQTAERLAKAIPEAMKGNVQTMQMEVKVGAGNLDGAIKAGRSWQQENSMPDMLKEQGSTSSTSTPQGSPRLGKSGEQDPDSTPTGGDDDVDDYVDEYSPFALGHHQEAMVPCSSKVRPMLVIHLENLNESEGSRRSVSL